MSKKNIELEKTLLKGENELENSKENYTSDYDMLVEELEKKRKEINNIF